MRSSVDRNVKRGTNMRIVEEVKNIGNSKRWHDIPYFGLENKMKMANKVRDVLPIKESQKSSFDWTVLPALLEVTYEQTYEISTKGCAKSGRQVCS